MDKARKQFADRTSYLTRLNDDITSNEALLEQCTKNIAQLELNKASVNQLSEYPEHEALIPLGKNIFMPGRLIHTGEFEVRVDAEPYSYQVLKSWKQTMQGIDERIKQQKKVLKDVETVINQIQERKNVILGLESESQLLKDELPVADLSGMPLSIESDKGVAVKVGNYFEIIEYEEN
ncbi:uncharacterized protein LOC126265932 [Aethina tumida]|uniref:uncharacterized protein LOC126265932 n=1 Tax=Aethina tumida TaxID=116153 RepID=UPI002147BEB0|nr:uncharacterized protein LOC126265932 [Aethina tumida]